MIFSKTLLSAFLVYSSFQNSTLVFPINDLTPKFIGEKKSEVPQSKAYIINYLPRNYVKDASIDYTSIIQNVISLNSDIVFPDFPLLINDDGLKIPSNRTITFLKGSELRKEPTFNPGYAMLLMRNSDNVRLINPVLKGDRYQHLGEKGEYGMGISIYGGSNITLLNPKITEMWGDGIYLGAEHNNIPTNISIKNAKLIYNRRNGISIISVDTLNLDSPYAAFTNGTKPMAGIDIEPNNKNQQVKNVTINNPRTQENGGPGIMIDVGNLMGGGEKKVNIIVNNHIDTKSNTGSKTSSRIRDASGSSITGEIVFINPQWINNSFKAVTTLLYGKSDVHLIIENPKIILPFNKTLTKDETIEYMKYKKNINLAAWYTIRFSDN